MSSVTGLSGLSSSLFQLAGNYSSGVTQNLSNSSQNSSGPFLNPASLTTDSDVLNYLKAGDQTSQILKQEHDYEVQDLQSSLRVYNF